MAALIVLPTLPASASNPQTAHKFKLPFGSYFSEETGVPPQYSNTATGLLVFQRQNGDEGTCSAFVSGENEVSTAAHCVMDNVYGGNGGDPAAYVKHVWFYPEYNYGSGLPTFPAHVVEANYSFRYYGDDHSDFASVGLNKVNGQSVASMTGTLGIVFNRDPSVGQDPIYLKGYPENHDNGEALWQCKTWIGQYQNEGGAIAPNDGFYWEAGCDMQDGASGGPFEDPSHYVWAVISERLTYYNVPVLIGSYLQPESLQTYNDMDI